MHWISALKLTLLGSGFDRDSLPNPYSRLITNTTAEVALRDLAADSAGLAIEFTSDSSNFTANYTLLSSELSMWHMPSSGVSGVDLYTKLQPSDGIDPAANVNGEWMFVGVMGIPAFPNTSGNLIGGVNQERNMREWRIHLPTYNNIVSLDIGVDDDAKIHKSNSLKHSDNTVVWYGSSIAQGAVASRPGNIFTNIIRNKLNVDVINLGFSGSCHFDDFVAEEIVKIKGMTMLVVDCLPNMMPFVEQVTEKTISFVQQVKSVVPDVKIVLAEDTNKGSFWVNDEINEVQTELRANMRAGFEQLKADGVTGLFYITADELYPTSTSPTTEGTHLSDLGMATLATFYIGYLPSIF
ncbi:hypothetical protein ScalyP_jg4015 [Parmales sp. scaly parma]|nr:hypothetical protein ScalyP_jg4015 [Parmales sp. scaly parma]|tara:strand:+ start:258 stop:1316 length:1059 start_codon:yes stop_codon:yes gene_type:complete